jgi:hypothetical protein
MGTSMMLRSYNLDFINISRFKIPFQVTNEHTNGYAYDDLSLFILLGFIRKVYIH